MFETEYVDYEGRKFWIRLPDGAQPDDYQFGLRLGPPDLSQLGLPLAVEVRVHNELYYRRLFHFSDVKRKRQDLVGALMAALKLDADKLLEVYRVESLPSEEE